MIKLFMDERKNIPNYNFYRKEYDSKLCFILLFASFLIPYFIENLIFIFNSPKAAVFTVMYFTEGVTPSIIANIIVIGFFCNRRKLIIEKTEGNKEAIEKYNKIKIINSTILMVYMIMISVLLTILFVHPDTFFKVMSSDLDISSSYSDISQDDQV